MKLIKFISFFCACLALLNTVDVHALSHALHGDDHQQIEHCDNCKEFVVSTQEDAPILLQNMVYTFQYSNFDEQPLLTSPKSIFINQEKHLGIFHNKPPPFTI